MATVWVQLLVVCPWSDGGGVSGPEGVLTSPLEEYDSELTSDSTGMAVDDVESSMMVPERGQVPVSVGVESTMEDLFDDAEGVAGW